MKIPIIRLRRVDTVDFVGFRIVIKIYWSLDDEGFGT
jgi:hypothetical protein